MGLVVVSIMKRRAEISAFDRPRATCSSTSYSRGVSVSRAGPRADDRASGTSANRPITRRVIKSASSPSPAATVRMPSTSCSGALLSVGVFWLGVFSVAIAGAAWLLAMEARRHRNHPAATTAALAVAALTVLLSIVVVIAS